MIEMVRTKPVRTLHGSGVLHGEKWITVRSQADRTLQRAKHFFVDWIVVGREWYYGAHKTGVHPTTIHNSPLTIHNSPFYD